MSAAVLTVGLHGLNPYLVRVTATHGGPFAISGMSEGAARDARVRVRSALAQIGVDVEGIGIAIEPAPSGPVDLAIAMSVLVLLGRVAPSDALYIGELDLSGNVRAVRGVLPMLGVGYNDTFVPIDNGYEAAWADRDIFAASHLRDILPGGDVRIARRADAPSSITANVADVPCPSTRRVLEIAAAGRHNLLLVGPRGSGAMLAAKALTGILPPMTHEESLMVTSIHSVAGLLQGGLKTQRPFRAPHHSVSAAGMVGGGSPPRPGEASLAHYGVLYLEDMQDCRASVLGALDDVMRSGSFAIERQGNRHEFPAAPLLVGHVWPCPCGEHVCKCKPERIKAYRERLQGLPIWQRFDMRTRLCEPSSRGQESSAEVQARVIAATRNPQLCWTEDARQASFTVPVRQWREETSCVTHTIATLAGASEVGPSHVVEAISYAMPWPE